MAKKTCFVIGPIGASDSPERAHADDLIEFIIAPCPALEEFDYDKPIRADQLNEPGRITSQIIKLLMDADLVIADLTDNNPNVYYELALRDALGKPVIHMALDGTSLSFDIQDNRTIFYTMHSRVAEGARKVLDSQICHVHAEGYKAMNPILETAGIITLKRSDDPQEQVVGELAQSVQALSAEIGAMRSDIRNIQSATEVIPLQTGGAYLALGAQTRDKRRQIAWERFQRSQRQAHNEKGEVPPISALQIDEPTDE